jgi:enterochelin esterase-like enzyme
MVLLAPAGVDPQEDTDVVTSPDHFYGKNVYKFDGGDIATLSGGSRLLTDTGVWGFPNVNMNDVAPGQYTVQAFLNRYETVTRSDGSIVSVRFPCGDGALPVNGPGSLTTETVNVTIAAKGPQTIKLTFTDVTPVEAFNGTEVGGCSQGNYEDTEFLKYVKIRSSILSKFWNRDMYVGATVLLPHGYDASDKSKRYPVLYHQNHWTANEGAYGYSNGGDFTTAWESGIIPGVNGTADRETPKLIIIQFRHEAPFYDDSYAVNTANLGPYGDALNDELIPHLEKTFKTIPHPYARIQDGGSTGGWESAANMIFRPDLFGACFSSYPDSLDFHKHQDIPLYTASNAYTRPDGSKITSIREVVNGTLTDITSVEQENHWELTFGTSSRSALQWDVWNAVFGVQGLNGYPLEPWDKVTGEVYPAAVGYWKTMDLANWIASNWATKLDLGNVLRRRIFIYVGSWDNYFLNEGVMEFQKTVSAKGGPDWANVTILEGEQHGGVYQRREVWDYLELVQSWIKDHAPDGKTPLSAKLTTPSARGNKWADVIAQGGHKAALARQAPPVVRKNGHATVGRWDPGVKLEAQWVVDRKRSGKPFAVKQGAEVVYKGTRWFKKTCTLQLAVTGRKRGYADETRKSNGVKTKV